MSSGHFRPDLRYRIRSHMTPSCIDSSSDSSIARPKVHSWRFRHIRWHPSIFVGLSLTSSGKFVPGDFMFKRRTRSYEFIHVGAVSSHTCLSILELGVARCIESMRK